MAYENALTIDEVTQRGTNDAYDFIGGKYATESDCNKMLYVHYQMLEEKRSLAVISEFIINRETVVILNVVVVEVVVVVVGVVVVVECSFTWQTTDQIVRPQFDLETRMV